MRAPVAFLAALTFATAAAADILDMTDAERETFRAEVRTFLIENPEVLMEAIGVLEQRQAEAQAQGDVDLVRANADALFDDGRSWVGGNLDGDLTMVEFLDYRCGYCRRAHPEVTDLVETDGEIRFIVKEFPILGEQSLLASRFAIATRILAGDEAYKDVHDALITLRGDVTRPALEKLAADFDLDAAEIFRGMDAPEVDAEIGANRALADELGIGGTPTFVVGDQMLRGYMPLSEMLRVVEAARAE